MDNEYLYRGAKEQLVKLLCEKGIEDKKVLEAFLVVDRHKFLESFLWDKAYEDIAIPIYCDQTISQPFTVAFQTQLLKITKGDKVLEIGTGSGFQAAILSAMGAVVYSVERQIDLYKKTKSLLDKIDNRIITHYGDGFLGFSRYAPFDKIIVTCGAPNVPAALLSQLKINGTMVIPVGNSTQEMKRITKTDEQEYKEETFGNFTFVPMLENIVKNNPS